MVAAAGAALEWCATRRLRPVAKDEEDEVGCASADLALLASYAERRARQAGATMILTVDTKPSATSTSTMYVPSSLIGSSS